MSRKLILFVALSGLVSTAMAQTTVAPAIPRDENIEKKVEALLEKMTLEENLPLTSLPNVIIRLKSSR